MPSRRKKLTGKSMHRRLKNGFGQGGAGTGQVYKPWLRVTDVPSRGTCTVITGWKDGNRHHLLSQIELRYFYLCEWSDEVVEIREQYPCLPLEATLELAGALGIRHPQSKGEPLLITCDFMISVRKGNSIVTVARTVKMTADLAKPRTLQKLEIERRYFEERGIDWGVVTEKDIPDPVWRNIDWLHEVRSLGNLSPLCEAEVRSVSEFLCKKIAPQRTVVLAPFCLEVDARLGTQPGTALKVARFLLARKVLAVDITKRIRTDEPITIQVKSMEHLWN